MVGMGGGGVYLLPTDVREDPLCISRVPGDQRAHRIQALGLALGCRRIVKGEAKTEHNGASERFTCIRIERLRGAVEIAIHKVSGNPPHLTAIENWEPSVALCNVDDTHY